MRPHFPIKANMLRANLLSVTVALSMTGCSLLPTQQISPGQQVTEEPPKELRSLGDKQTLTPRLLWQKKIDNPPRGYVELHPAVSGDLLIVAGKNTVSALNRNSGSTVWTETIPQNISGGVNVDTDTVYLGTRDGSAIALDKNTGKTRWITLLKHSIVSVSTSKDNKVVFRTLSGKIHVLSTKNGDQLWQRTHNTPVLSLQGASTPLLAGPYVVTGFDDGNVAAYELESGKEAWSLKLGLESGLTELSQLIDIDAEMKTVGTVLFAASYQGFIAGIDMRSGKAGWNRKLSSYTGIDANEKELFVTNNEGELWKLVSVTGQPEWSNDDLLRRVPTAPVMVGNSYVVVGDKLGYLHWFNRNDGSIAGRTQADASGFNVAPVVAGSTVYSLSKSGLISAYQTN